MSQQMIENIWEPGKILMIRQNPTTGLWGNLGWAWKSYKSTLKARGEKFVVLLDPSGKPTQAQITNAIMKAPQNPIGVPGTAGTTFGAAADIPSEKVGFLARQPLGKRRVYYGLSGIAVIVVILLLVHGKKKGGKTKPKK